MRRTIAGAAALVMSGCYSDAPLVSPQMATDARASMDQCISKAVADLDDPHEAALSVAYAARAACALPMDNFFFLMARNGTRQDFASIEATAADAEIDIATQAVLTARRAKRQ